MKLSRAQVAIIAAHPFDTNLDRIRTEIGECAPAATRNIVVKLLAALALSPAALHLLGTTGFVDLISKLALLRSRVHNGTVDHSQCRLLVERVVNKSTDYEIWKTAVRLVDTLLPLPSPLAKYPTTFRAKSIQLIWDNDTDIEPFSQSRERHESDLLRTFRYRTFRNVSGFCKKFFSDSSWNSNQKALLNKLLARHDGRRWIDLCSDPDQDSTVQWIDTLLHDTLNDAPNQSLTSSCTDPDKSGDVQKNMFFLHPQANSDFSPSYANVLVVGVLKGTCSAHDFDNNFSKLAWHVRCVFTDQPLRLFVHAFLLCGSSIEFWVFDRSGAYSSGVFDIHLERSRFGRALVAYASMQGVETGRNGFVWREGQHDVVTLIESGQSYSDRTFRLNKAMVRKEAIISRATTCYGTEEGFVAKFAWLSDQHSREIDLLRQAERSNVRGVPRVIAHRQLATVADLRKGLTFPSAHHFHRNDDNNYNIETQLTPAVTRTSRKRRLPAHSSSSQTHQHQKLESERSFRTVTSTNLTSSPHSTGPIGQQWEDKAYACFVISPAGRVISDFQTIQEMLEAMADAIKAHRSLHDDAGILHRDVSPRNILITDPERASGLKGMLIDLDVAKELDHSTEEASHATGTLPFMALNVLLRKEKHSFRHDLESFFWVLLWLCARQAWDNGFGVPNACPQNSRVEKWNEGTLNAIATSKGYHLIEIGFAEVMDDFPESLECLKPLCWKLRYILFGDPPGFRFDTPVNGSDDLYDAVIQAFEKTIEQERSDSEVTN